MMRPLGSPTPDTPCLLVQVESCSKPAYNVDDLVMQHMEELEREAEAKGGVIALVADHFARIYRVGARWDVDSLAA